MGYVDMTEICMLLLGRNETNKDGENVMPTN
jgi:hypothetical protein